MAVVAAALSIGVEVIEVGFVGGAGDASAGHRFFGHGGAVWTLNAEHRLVSIAAALVVAVVLQVRVVGRALEGATRRRDFRVASTFVVDAEGAVGQG